MQRLFTIGYSSHSFRTFVRLLKMHNVTAVADVRSNPVSTLSRDFNGNELFWALKSRGIKYAYLGKELGARRIEAECYHFGKAKYHRIAQLPIFHKGLDRIRKGSRDFTIVILCAEKDPLECHRFILVCRHLRTEFQIGHIREDGSIETNEEAETRLLIDRNVENLELFRTRDELILHAYDLQGERIAYVDKSQVFENPLE